ncbi:MAG: Asp-tRNA(Asn)/Glu-tRNA(Gln) amidotransferase subunit GatB, partial [Candidatus Limnocylindrales bacterium]
MTAPVASPSATGRYEAVIGIEIHVQLRTRSKMFCGCSTDFQAAPPNSHTCPICLGMPGTLPVANRLAVEHVLATGLALEAEIVPVTRWDRKNYFYPDLPKGYQISQYDLPLTQNGRLSFDTSEGPFTVGIRRAHLEEDTARLLHMTGDSGDRASLVDFNRSGVALMEIVTEPDLRTAEQARRYAEELRLLLLTIGASEAALESGQMRVEANVSLRPIGADLFGTRVEVKNMNSFRSVERAIGHEIERQAGVLSNGGDVIQETRGWDENRAATYTMRLKEDSQDYRYFPEPDLPALKADPAWLDEIRARQPELPAARRARYRAELGLSAYDANVIVGDLKATRVFEGALAAESALPAKRVANWVTGEYLRLAKGSDAIDALEPAELGRLLRLVDEGTLSGTSAKEVFARIFAGERTAAVVEELGLAQISDGGALETAVDEVLAANPAAVEDIRAGK